MTYLPVESRIVAALKAAGITVPVYRGSAVPDTVRAPYVLVAGGPLTPQPVKRGRDSSDVWMVQRYYVEVYQYTVTDRGARVEDPALPLRVLTALSRLSVPGGVTPLVVEGSVTVPDPDPAVRHDSITVRAEFPLAV